MSNIVCDFGCERAAIRRLKNGRFLCAEFVSQCPAMRAKNAASKRGKNPFVNRAHPRGMAGKVPWNRGLTWEQMFGREEAARLRGIGRANVAKALQILKASPELEALRREKLSAVARRRGLGGYERGSGRGKKGWYRGFWCDSTYELAFVVWALDHDIPFERNLKQFPYEYQGHLMYWMPDFRLADGTFIEIKGYVTPQVQAKFEFFLPSLRVLTRTDLQDMFDYVQSRYGRNFVALYE